MHTVCEQNKECLVLTFVLTTRPSRVNFALVIAQTLRHIKYLTIVEESQMLIELIQNRYCTEQGRKSFRLCN